MSESRVEEALLEDLVEALALEVVLECHQQMAGGHVCFRCESQRLSRSLSAFAAFSPPPPPLLSGGAGVAGLPGVGAGSGGGAGEAEREAVELALPAAAMPLDLHLLADPSPALGFVTSAPLSIGAGSGGGAAAENGAVSGTMMLGSGSGAVSGGVKRKMTAMAGGAAGGTGDVEEDDESVGATLDVFGLKVSDNKMVNQQFSCTNCGSRVTAHRFAPHLEKCMGRSRSVRRTRRKQSKGRSGSGSSSGMYGEFVSFTDEDFERRLAGQVLPPSSGRGSARRTEDQIFAALMRGDKDALLDNLTRKCCALGPTTGRLCANSLNCSQHTAEERKRVRAKLMPQLVKRQRNARPVRRRKWGYFAFVRNQHRKTRFREPAVPAALPNINELISAGADKPLCGAGMVSRGRIAMKTDGEYLEGDDITKYFVFGRKR